jgi:hypothetical protein
VSGPRIRKLVKARDLSAKSVVVALLERGIGAQQRKEREFFASAYGSPSAPPMPHVVF